MPRLHAGANENQYKKRSYTTNQDYAPDSMQPIKAGGGDVVSKGPIMQPINKLSKNSDTNLLKKSRSSSSNIINRSITDID